MPSNLRIAELDVWVYDSGYKDGDPNQFAAI